MTLIIILRVADLAAALLDDRFDRPAGGSLIEHDPKKEKSNCECAIEFSGFYSFTVMVIVIGSRGLLYSSRGAAAILSTTSIPRHTSPKML